MSVNQDMALSSWRRAASEDNPKPYSVATMFGRTLIFLSVNKNVGWYFPVLSGGHLTSLYSPFGLNALQWVGTQQRLKIAAALKPHIPDMPPFQNVNHSSEPKP